MWEKLKLVEEHFKTITVEEFEKNLEELFGKYENVEENNDDEI